MAADKPEFTTDRPGGGGIRGSKARVVARLKEHGWEDVIKVCSGAGFAAQGSQAFRNSSYSFPSTRQSCLKQVTALLKVQPMR